MTRVELQRLARIGAEARLAALQREIQSIYQVFPDLQSGRAAVIPPPDRDGHSAPRPGRRRRPRMSAAARQRIVEAQRKRWAEWRKKKEKAGS